MRNNSSTHSPLNSIRLEEEWTSHPAIEWLSANKKILIIGFSAFLICLILMFRFAISHSTNDEKDFFQAQKAFHQLQEKNPSDSVFLSQFEELSAIMQRHPEIKPRFEGSLAHSFAIRGETDKADKLIQNIFERIQTDNLDFYKEFSQTTLLINKGELRQALTKAENLHSALELSKKNQNILFLFNLIRLAMLYQLTDQHEKELIAWENLQNEYNHLDEFLLTNKVFTIGQTSLYQYILERKKDLSKS